MQYTHLYAHHDSLLIYFVASVVRVQLSYPPEQDSFFTHLEESH